MPRHNRRRGNDNTILGQGKINKILDECGPGRKPPPDEDEFEAVGTWPSGRPIRRRVAPPVSLVLASTVPYNPTSARERKTRKAAAKHKTGKSKRR